MTQPQRIRLARRHAGLSQASLATAVGVQRSAVSHWEANDGKHPSVNHLRELALVCGVQFEWLATGRGKMSLSADTALDSVAAADALLIEDPIELRLILVVSGCPDTLAGAAGGGDRTAGRPADGPAPGQPARRLRPPLLRHRRVRSFTNYLYSRRLFTEGNRNVNVLFWRLVVACWPAPWR